MWFKGNAEEAVNFYLSIFPDGKIKNVTHYPKNAEEGLADFQKDFAGKVLTIDFELFGQLFTAINADNTFTPNEAFSLLITCQDQEEIDHYYSKLSSNPESEICGWCKDKYGFSWQIVPENMDELIKQPGAFANMMQMKKIIIAEL